MAVGACKKPGFYTFSKFTDFLTVIFCFMEHVCSRELGSLREGTFPLEEGCKAYGLPCFFFFSEFCATQKTHMRVEKVENWE